MGGRGSASQRASWLCSISMQPESSSHPHLPPYSCALPPDAVKRLQFKAQAWQMFPKLVQTRQTAARRQPDGVGGLIACCVSPFSIGGWFDSNHGNQGGALGNFRQRAGGQHYKKEKKKGDVWLGRRCEGQPPGGHPPSRHPALMRAIRTPPCNQARSAPKPHVPGRAEPSRSSPSDQEPAVKNESSRESGPTAAESKTESEAFRARLPAR